MPFPFRRKPTSLVKDALTSTSPGEGGESAPTQRTAQDQSAARTPSKRERGIVTPKRTAGRRPVEPPPANRREAYRRMRDRERAEREERRRGMAEGDERFMLKRDQGPERALVRDIVDHRLTVGTWFFAGALIVLIGGAQSMPPQVRLGANLVWMAVALATIIDSFLIARQIKKHMRARFPKSTVSMARLYYYGIVRAIVFRRMRMPRPRIKLGQDF